MRRQLVSTLIVIGLALAGCGGGYEPPETPEPAAPTMSAEELEAKLTVLLARADAADSTEDRVVHKCLGCGLAMDGSAEHVVEAHGYELHLCSAGCERRVGEDVDEAILALGDLDDPSTDALR